MTSPTKPRVQCDRCGNPMRRFTTPRLCGFCIEEARITRHETCQQCGERTGCRHTGARWLCVPCFDFLFPGEEAQDA